MLKDACGWVLIRPKSIGSTNVADIAIDRDGSLWISSFGEGLSIMTDTERGIFQNYKKKDFEK